MPFRFTLWSSLAQFTQGIRKEFSNPDRLSQRLLDEAETLLSVLLAIGMAHYLAVDNVGWAAFSGYMVMRSSLHDCVYRGGLRIIGTAAGGLAAAALLTQLQISVHCLGPVIGLVGACTQCSSPGRLLRGRCLCRAGFMAGRLELDRHDPGNVHRRDGRAAHREQQPLIRLRRHPIFPRVSGSDGA